MKRTIEELTTAIINAHDADQMHNMIVTNTVVTFDCVVDTCSFDCTVVLNDDDTVTEECDDITTRHASIEAYAENVSYPTLTIVF